MHITVCVVQQRKQGRHVLVQLLCYNKELSKRAEVSFNSNTNHKKRTQMSVVFQIFMPPCLKFDFNSSICTSSFKCGQLFKNLLSPCASRAPYRFPASRIAMMYQLRMRPFMYKYMDFRTSFIRYPTTLTIGISLFCELLFSNVVLLFVDVCCGNQPRRTFQDFCQNQHWREGIWGDHQRWEGLLIELHICYSY